MKYSNSLVSEQITPGKLSVSRSEICSHCHQPISVPPPRKAKNKHLWVDAVALLQRTQALALAHKAVEWVEKPLLAKTKKGRAGAKPIYTDATVLLTFLVAKLWHLSYEEMLAWLHNWPLLAHSLGYPTDPKTAQLRIISLGSYSKRLRTLSLAVYFAFFVLLMRQLLHKGVLAGRDLIIDSTILRAWSLADAYCAVSYKYKDVNKRFGVKVHTVIDRVSGLPIMLSVSSANLNDGPFALPLLKAAVQLYNLKVAIVRGDAAYHCAALYHWVVIQIKAIWAVDYNVRRRGKKQLANRAQMKYWRAFMRPRATIERFFAWAKRYYKLKYFKVQGHAAISRHVLGVYIAMLLVGFVAWQAKRPDLMRSPSRVLAYFDA